MTVSIPLSRGLFALIDEDDYERVSKYKWYAKPCRKKDTGWYAISAKKTPREYLHRFIMRAQKGLIVDHIDGDGLNCRRANLRVGDLSLNAINRHTFNPTGYRGVQQDRHGRFRACVTHRQKMYRSRSVGTAIEAAQAYDLLAIRHHGAAAILNFPDVIA